MGRQEEAASQTTRQILDRKWQEEKPERFWKGKGQSRIKISACWSPISRWSYSSASEEPYNIPWSCGSNCRRLLCRYPRVFDCRGFEGEAYHSSPFAVGHPRRRRVGHTDQGNHCR